MIFFWSDPARFRASVELHPPYCSRLANCSCSHSAANTPLTANFFPTSCFSPGSSSVPQHLLWEFHIFFSRPWIPLPSNLFILIIQFSFPPPPFFHLTLRFPSRYLYSLKKTCRPLLCSPFSPFPSFEEIHVERSA